VLHNVLSGGKGKAELFTLAGNAAKIGLNAETQSELKYSPPIASIILMQYLRGYIIGLIALASVLSL